MALAPAERMLALETRLGGDPDIWLLDLERRAQTRFAFGPARQGDPAWSPDGREVAWFEGGVNRIIARPADGSQAERQVCRGYSPQYSPDGRYLVYGNFANSTASDIWYATRAAPPDSFPIVSTPAGENLPVPSPQGAHVIYVSTESGRAEIWLRQFPSGDGRWQVSTNGGGKALWSREGDRIYYWSGDQVFEVPVELQPAVRLGAPRLLFDLAALGMQTAGRFNCVPTSDPDRFLMLLPRKERFVSPVDVVVVENWPAEFARK
jgi:Tol biopolymer transport system component